MKTRLQFFNPNKKTVSIFTAFSVVMIITMLQGENFSKNDPSIFYTILFPVIEPTWKVWLYVSAPVLYFVGIFPQSTIRWFYPDSWEIIYGLNFVYYYFVSAIIASVWNFVADWKKRK